MSAAEVIAAVLIGYILRWCSEPRRVAVVRVVVPKGNTVSLTPMDGTQVVPATEDHA